MSVKALIVLVALHAAPPPGAMAWTQPAARAGTPVRDGLGILPGGGRWRAARADDLEAADDPGAQPDGGEAEATLQAEQKRSAALMEHLSDLQRSTAAQINRLQQQLENEQAQAASRELASAREQLAQAERMRASEGAARQPLEASIRDKDAKLRDEQRRSAALAQQVDYLQKRFEDQQAQAAVRDRDLASARERGERLARDKDGETAARQKLEAVLATGAKDLRAAGGEVDDLKGQLAAQRAQVVARDRDLLDVRAQLAQAAQTGTRDDAKTQPSQADIEDRDARVRVAQQRASDLAAELARTGQAAATQAQTQAQVQVQVQDLAKQLGDEKAQAAARDRDAASLRAQLVQGRDAAVRDAARDAAARVASEAALRDGNAKLAAAQSQAAASADQLASGRRADAARIADLAKRFDEARLTADKSAGGLAVARQQLVQATRAAQEAAQARDTAVTAAAAERASLSAERTRLDAERARAGALAQSLAARRRRISPA